MAFYEITIYMQKFIRQPIAAIFSNNVQWNALSPSDTWKKGPSNSLRDIYKDCAVQRL